MPHHNQPPQASTIYTAARQQRPSPLKRRCSYLLLTSRLLATCRSCSLRACCSLAACCCCLLLAAACCCYLLQPTPQPHEQRITVRGGERTNERDIDRKRARRSARAGTGDPATHGVRRSQRRRCNLLLACCSDAACFLLPAACCCVLLLLAAKVCTNTKHKGEDQKGRDRRPRHTRCEKEPTPTLPPAARLLLTCCLLSAACCLLLRAAAACR